MHVVQKESTLIVSNNTAAITVQSNPVNSEKSQHMTTKYNMELSQFDVITYKKVHTYEPAEIGTKMLQPELRGV